MKNFLVTYDRKSGLTSIATFDTLEEANTARIEAEQKFSDNYEVVALTADSEASLRISHSRYFRTVSQILNDMKTS